MAKRYSIPKVNGRWPRKSLHLIPCLTGTRAFYNSMVENFWNYMIYYYKPNYNVALITPCSNVKPYPLSPMNRKIIGILKRSKLWDEDRKKPLIEWLFLSDLLGFVPFTHTWIPPACCYDVPPDIVEENSELYMKIKNVIDKTWLRIHTYFDKAIIYLPKRYHKLLPKDYGNPSKIIVKYNIFDTKILQKVLTQQIITRENSNIFWSSANNNDR